MYLLPHKILYLLIIAPLLLTACTTSSGSKSTLYGLERGVPPHIILLDISGSMGDGSGDTIKASVAGQAINTADRSIKRVNTGWAIADNFANKLRNGVFDSARKQTTKLAEAKRQIIPFIRGLPDGTQFNVIAFNDSLAQAQDKIITASSQSKMAAITFTNSLQAQNGTLIIPALQQAIAQHPTTIYLVSDGHPNDSQSTILSIAKTAAAQGIVINTVGIGKDQSKAFLSQIAQITGGVFNSQGTSIPILRP